MSNIKDVAARAGVSQSTVHYALNGKRSISETVRQRVMAAVTELDYTASALGQRMREGRSYSIAMIAPQFPSSDAAIMEMLGTTAATASQADYTLGIFMGQTPDQMLQLLRNKYVEGLLLVDTNPHDPRIECLRNSKYPFVLLGRTENLDGLSWVDFDFEQATFLAFENLVQFGHKSIGFVAPHHRPEDAGHNPKGLERAQAKYDFEVVQSGIGSSFQDGYSATLELLERAPQISAIVAGGHTHTGVLRALYSRQMRVPDDCSVIGITTAQVAEWTIPKLTSVDIPLAAMSEYATKLLLRKVSGEVFTEHLLEPAKLVTRESTAPFKR